MITSEQQAKILALLASHPVAVIATASAEAVPGAAVVLYAEQDDLSLIFGTHQTRKYQNLTANPACALAVSKELESVQLHGRAVVAPDQAAAQQVFLAKHPEMDKQLVAGSVFFQFTPTWVRYLDYSVQPPAQWEGVQS